MWNNKGQSRRKNQRGDSDSGEILYLASTASKNFLGKVFFVRLGVTLLAALIGLSSIGVLTWLGAYSIGRYLLFQNDLFCLRNVTIECDGEVVTPKHITEYLALNTCSNLFAFNMAQERSSLLKKVPRIKNAELARRLPGEIIILIHERLPIARLEMGQYYLTVDSEGRVLGTSSGSKYLPIITGHEMPGLRPGIHINEKRITRALEVIHACDTTPTGNYVKIARIEAGSPAFLVLTLMGNEQVRFSWIGMIQDSPSAKDNLNQKLAKLAESLRSAAARGKKITSIDMTVENNFPAIEY